MIIFYLTFELSFTCLKTICSKELFQTLPLCFRLHVFRSNFLLNYLSSFTWAHLYQDSIWIPFLFGFPKLIHFRRSYCLSIVKIIIKLLRRLKLPKRFMRLDYIWTVWTQILNLLSFSRLFSFHLWTFIQMRNLMLWNNLSSVH